MCASSILELFELASELHDIQPPKARGIVTLLSFWVNSWQAALGLRVLGAFVAIYIVTNAAVHRATADRRNGLSVLGLPPSGVFRASYLASCSL
jgi:hypothetical protein